MKMLIKALAFLVPFLMFPVLNLAADTLTCVGLFSETDEGSVSYRVPKHDWVVIKLGDVIPASAEIRVNVAQDWIEVTPTRRPSAVYEIDGSDQGEVIKKVSALQKERPKLVKFPKASKKTDPEFKDKLVVKSLLGRQIYRASPDTPEQDMRYGDVLDIKGKVRIIGINNTLTLMFPNGAVTTVIGPLDFPIQKVFNGSNLYKYLNVTK